MNRWLILVILTLNAGCSGLRRPVPVGGVSSSVVSPSTGSTSLRKMIPRGSSAIPVSNGFVTLGCSQPSLYNFCMTVMDANGQSLREFGDLPRISLGSGSYITATSLAFYPPSDVVIAGHTSESLGEPQGGAGDGFVARYTLSGSRVWIKQFGASTLGLNSNQREDFFDIAVDAGGSIYVAGRTRSNFGSGTPLNSGQFDALVLKLDANGLMQWVKLDGSPKDEEYRKVVVAPSGDVLAGGQTCGNLFEPNAVVTTDPDYQSGSACPSEKARDLIFSAYSPTGNLKFHRQLGAVSLPAGKARHSELLTDMVSNSSGDLFFTGGTASHLATLGGEGNGGGTDLFLGRIGSTGSLQWIRQWGSLTPGASGNDLGKSLTLRADISEIFVCGETFGNLLEAQGGTLNKGDLVLLRVNQDGIPIGATHFGAQTLGDARSSQRDSCGRIWMNSSGVVLFGNSGSTLFSGTGSSFMVRDSASKFLELLR